MAVLLAEALPEGVGRGGDLPRRPRDAQCWSLETLAGRYVEVVSGESAGGLTAAAAIIAQAQEQRCLAAWVSRGTATFFPPDFAAAGIDVAALPVVFAEDTVQLCRATETLLRSGSFAVVVLDLGGRDELPIATQTRLLRLAEEHNTAFVCLLRKRREKARRGSLVSLRMEAETKRMKSGGFVCALRALKDKRGTPGWTHTEVFDGPDGLC